MTNETFTLEEAMNEIDTFLEGKCGDKKCDTKKEMTKQNRTRTNAAIAGGAVTGIGGAVTLRHINKKIEKLVAQRDKLAGNPMKKKEVAALNAEIKKHEKIRKIAMAATGVGATVSVGGVINHKKISNDLTKQVKKNKYEDLEAAQNLSGGSRSGLDVLKGFDAAMKKAHKKKNTKEVKESVDYELDDVLEAYLADDIDVDDAIALMEAFDVEESSDENMMERVDDMLDRVFEAYQNDEIDDDEFNTLVEMLDLENYE